MKLTRVILMDVLIGACIYAWRFEHMEAARVFLQFWLWFVCAMHWVFALFASEKHLFKRSKIMILYDLVSTVTLTAALLWLGWVTLAIALFLGWVFTTARLDGYKGKAA
jgi:hypothetical protein